MSERRMTWDDELSNIKVGTLFWLSAKIVAVNIIWFIIFIVIIAVIIGAAD